MKKPKIIVIAGSLRKDSLNKKLAKSASDMVSGLDAEATFIDLKDYPMPIYDGDIEDDSGIPEQALKLKKIMEEADGFIFASPEYNSSISAALKNAIDWVSRQKNKDETPLSAFKGKTALLLSASPGVLGGLRGLVHLRSILGNINVHVVPGQKAISKAMDAFDDKGQLAKESDRKAVQKLIENFVEVTGKLSKL